MDALRTGLLWLDADPLRFWLTAWAAFGATIVLALRSSGDGPAANPPGGVRPQTWIFWASVGLTLAAFRWPSWFYPAALNPDEAQMIAGAITLQRFPVYWKFVDGTTHGPLCEYLLLVPAWLGAPLNYVTARVLAAGLEVVALAGVWGALRCFAPERIARLAILPGLAFWSFASHDDFLHYATELPGIALLSQAGWAIATALAAPRPGRRPALLLYLGGLCLGAVPFAKVQSAPQAAALAAAAAVLWMIVRRPDPAAGRRGWGWLVLGGATVPGIILALVLVYGLGSQFWYSYIVSNLAYANLGEFPLREMPGRFFHVAAASSAFAWFLAGGIGFALLYARPGAGRPAAARVGIVVAWILLGVAYACVIRSGREVPHYLNLMVVPVVTLSGFVLAGAAAEAVPDPAKARARFAPLLCFALLTLAPQIGNRASASPPFLGQLSAAPSAADSAAARFIRARARPGDTLATWGWEPALYVETGLPQGTREAHTACELTTWSMQEFYLRRYVVDLTRRRPAWFVDVVGPGSFIYENRREFGHERVPEVNAVIEQDYEFLAEIGHQRIYRIRDAAPK